MTYWQISQLTDTGPQHPIVARLTVGIVEIVKFADITEDKKDSITSACFEIHKSLLQAEKSVRTLMNEIREIENNLIKNGVQTQNNGTVINIPWVANLDDSKSFLKFIKQSLQHLASAMGILLDKKFDGPHFHKILDECRSKLGPEHIVTKLLEEDQQWVKEINDLRNEDEHPKTGKPFVTGFQIQKTVEGKFLITPPSFYNGSPISNRIEVFSHNVLTFSEELLVHTLENHFPSIVRVYDIPEEQRDTSCPVRFRMGP